LPKRPDAGPGAGPADAWPLAQPDMPKIVALDVKCERNLMKVHIQFDKPFYGIVFSKGKKTRLGHLLSSYHLSTGQNP
jgi:hypothetical protein